MFRTRKCLYTRLAVYEGLLGLGLGLASQASRVYLPRMAIHTATGKVSRVCVAERLLHGHVTVIHLSSV